MQDGERTPKLHRAGTHRAVPPAETLARMRPLLPALGITRVANVTGLDHIGIPVFQACRPNSRSLSVSQGKGLDADAARVSAIMESVEAHHAENMRLPLALGTAAEMARRHAVIDVDGLPREPGSPFHRQLPLLWVAGEDWLRQEPVWVPYQCVHMNATPARLLEPQCFAGSSNGLASGNHRLEAVSHALCELVERDARRTFEGQTAAEQQARRVDLASIDDADCRSALRRFARAEMAVAVWDLSGAIGLPVFECLIVDAAEDAAMAQVPARGSGCHPLRAIALLRALTEAAQSRVTLIAGARDDIRRSDYERACSRDNLRLLRDQAREPATRAFAAAPSHDFASFDEDVALALDLLRRAGLEQVAVLDLSLPGIPASVVRVVVPGLREPQED
ncbi:YcaO domain-containing protein [Rubrivivax sp. A210]|uniref:YcaO-like family protein n=1 Tax=Rubrivivax sp. A210 TaxID=2772301 RepID=UPI001982B2F4|nr:YcaO-like family protein [Rubrivivax sp. A210]CAD5373295.1 YcaO domain-containing protein [Rubrivivax sp. A210]